MSGPAIVPILLYHSVCPDPARSLERWAISPERFREHLEFLATEGYRTLTVSAYVEALRTSPDTLPERVAVVTFDDGFADFTTGALPALVDTGTACTLYLSTAYMGAKSVWLGDNCPHDMLTWKASAEIAAAGVEIGAHAHRHIALDELSTCDAQREIVDSKQLIEEHLRRPVTSFAYPHGYHGAKVKAMVREAGYQNACGVKHALSGPGDDEYALARVIVEDVPAEQLRLMLERLRRAPNREQLQTTMWRTYRRARARLRPSVHASTVLASP